MRGNWPAAVASRIGLGGDVSYTPARCGQTLHLPCQGWGQHEPHIVNVPVAPGQHPDAIAKKLLKKGWRIGHRLVCPDGRKRKPTMNSNLKDRAMASTSDLALSAAAPTPPPTPAAGRARRLVYMALEEGYDEMKKLYRPNFSDASIARDCGVSEAVVKTIREESYGPLAVPSEIAALQAILLAATQTFAETSERANREVREAATVYGTSLKDVERQLDILARKNGWTR